MTFYIVDVEYFDMYKNFSVNDEIPIHFVTAESARAFMYSIINLDGLKEKYKDAYVQVYNENKIVVYIDDGSNKNKIYKVIEVHECGYIVLGDNCYKYKYRKYIIEEDKENSVCYIRFEDDGELISVKKTIDDCIEFINKIWLVCNNVIRVNGNFMVNTSPLNNGLLPS